MASDRGKRQEAGQNGDGVPHRRGKSAPGGNSARRSQGRKTRSGRKENAAAVNATAGNANEEGEGLDGSAAEVTAGKASKRPRTAQKVKQECKEKIIAEMGQIVTGLIEKAKRGSYNEAKLLLTIAEKDDGKRVEEKSAQAAADTSLAELLLGHLGEDEKPAAKAKAGGRQRKSTGKRRKSGAAPKRRRGPKRPAKETAKAPELQQEQQRQPSPELPRQQQDQALPVKAESTESAVPAPTESAAPESTESAVPESAASEVNSGSTDV